MNITFISCVRDATEGNIACGNSFRLRRYGSSHRDDHLLAVNPASIGSGYNECIAESDVEVLEKDVLVFVHSDVEFWNSLPLWKSAIYEAQKPDVGFVGLAGTSQLSSTGIWWQNNGHAFGRGSVNHTSNGLTYASTFGPYGDAVAMDGLFLMCKASLFKGPDALRWAETPKWNFYDIDICLKAHMRGLRNVVVPLPVLHHSIGLGALQDQYETDRQEFLKVWGTTLPVKT